MTKLLYSLAVFLLVVAGSTSVMAKGGSSGHGGGDDRVRIEVRADDDEPGEDRVRVEVRGDGANVTDAINLINSLDIGEDVNRIRVEARDDDDRVRIEVRDEEEDELPNFEIEGNTFEITGTVTAFSGGTVTIDGRTVTIDPGVANFEQEGIIEVGEVIKVEGMVSADGTLVAREIKADGIDMEDEIEAGMSGVSLTALLNQILTFLRSLV